MDQALQARMRARVTIMAESPPAKASDSQSSPLPQSSGGVTFQISAHHTARIMLDEGSPAAAVAPSRFSSNAAALLEVSTPSPPAPVPADPASRPVLLSQSLKRIAGSAAAAVTQHKRRTVEPAKPKPAKPPSAGVCACVGRRGASQPASHLPGRVLTPGGSRPPQFPRSPCLKTGPTPRGPEGRWGAPASRRSLPPSLPPPSPPRGTPNTSSGQCRRFSAKSSRGRTPSTPVSSSRTPRPAPPTRNNPSRPSRTLWTMPGTRPTASQQPWARGVRTEATSTRSAPTYATTELLGGG
jgi:hypothetical protein